MKKIIFLFGTVALLIIMVSCGQRAQNRNAAEQDKPEATVAVDTLSSPQMAANEFGGMLEEIYYGLPESVMPAYLKTEEQRREAESYFRKGGNSVYVYNFKDSPIYRMWDMAAYLTTDNSQMLLIVQSSSGADGFALDSSKTLLYDFKTKTVEEIECPVDPFTAEELLVESLFETPALAAKAKRYWNQFNQKVTYGYYDKDGFMGTAHTWGYDDDDYYGEKYDLSATRIWNGSRFVKGPQWSAGYPIEVRMRKAIDKDPSTKGMIDAYSNASKEWEAMINRNYQTLTECMGADADMTKLQTAQKAYEAFCNDEIAFNAYYWNSFGGTMHTMFPAEHQKDMNRYRAFQLAAYYNNRAITRGYLGENPGEETEEEWDKALNDNYKALMDNLETDNQNRLREAQRKWITYRDAEIDCYNSCCQITPNPEFSLLLVKERALQLKNYLVGGMEENPN